MKGKPVELNRTHREMTICLYVHSAAEHHREAVTRAGNTTERSRAVEASGEEMHERREGLIVTIRHHWTECVSVVIETYPVLRLVRAAEVRGYAEPIVKVPCDRCIPPVRIHTTIESSELIPAEDLSFRCSLHSLLGKRSQRYSPEQQQEPQ